MHDVLIALAFVAMVTYPALASLVGSACDEKPRDGMVPPSVSASESTQARQVS